MIDVELFKKRTLNSFRRAFSESYAQLSRLPTPDIEDYDKQDELHEWLTNLDCAIWELGNELPDEIQHMEIH